LNNLYFLKTRRLLLSVCIIVPVATVIGFAAAGCGTKQSTSTTSTKTTIVSGTTTKKSETPTTTKTSTPPTQAPVTTTVTKTVSDDPFIRLDDTLGDTNIRFQKTWMSAESIGAKEGYKYETSKGTFELYLFDKGSEAYQTATKNNALTVSGTLFPALIQDGFALYFYGNATEELKTKVKGILFP
jgi:hypothetical protein